MTKKKTQKVLIPKGTIDPNEDTLIEIPTELQETPIVVAKKLGFQDQSISIEKSSKIVEVEGDKYSISEDRSKIKVAKERDQGFSPRFQSTFRTPPENADSYWATSSNDPTVIENPVKRKFEKMQQAQKKLQQSAFLTTTSSKPSNISCKDSSSASATDRIPRCSFVSSDKSLQSKPSNLQNVSSVSSQKKSEPTTNVLYQSCSSGQDVSRFNSTKRSDNVSVSFKTCSSMTLQDFPEDVKSVSLKMDKQTSAVCLNQKCFKSSKQKEDKEIQSKYSEESCKKCTKQVSSTEQDFKSPSLNIENNNYYNKEDTASKYLKTEKKQSSQNECQRKKSKDSCRCEKISKKVSSTDKCLGRDALMDQSQDKIKTTYKCSAYDIDDIYVQQLKRQFEEAKRKLDDAVMLASMSLRQIGSKRHSFSKRPSLASSSQAASICNSVPERDISFTPSCGSSPSCVVYVPGPRKNPCRTSNEENDESILISDAYKFNDIYKNILTKRLNGCKPLKTCVQQDITDGPCPFFKVPNSINSDIRSARPRMLKKDTNTQTEPKENPDKTNRRAKQAENDSISLQSNSSRCLEACSNINNSNSSIEFVKKPHRNFMDKESELFGHPSTFMS